jgi:hypothetical protein
MSKSYRIRTKVGVDTSLKVLIEQEFEHLEILSLKILQSDIYTRQCSDYGVIVGRVSVNNGFGIPNAKVSIFIPIDGEDQDNPIISELYPYKSLLDISDDGYRYNLLPYVKSYSAHVPTGTFFTRTDVLTNPTLIEVYDKYYKYNAITNDSGDYMIFGVPVGSHTLVMDVDLSDIGEFSLSPQDLIRMGVATESQVAGTNFKSSNNLRELPQIINLSKSIEVEPLWGQPEICNLGIVRTDFDLSSEANIDIRPTSIFMGSIISGPNSSALTEQCRPPSRSGHLCNLTVGPGDILAIRQTVLQDSSGRPILENFTLENGGKVIDENGTWLIDVPMNLDYYTTNEFGEQVLSNDPEVGIPTKGKYRFKVKWAQSPSLGETIKRAHFLVPNIKEYGSPNIDESYSFSVDWNDYAYSGLTPGDVNNVLSKKIVQEAIDCEDRFYMMQYNKVYTVSQFINASRSGSGTERYIGIKNILDETCNSINNRFPTNDGNFRFDIIYIIFMFFSIILTPIFFVLILLLHILYFLIGLLIDYILPILIGWAAYQSGSAFASAIAAYPAVGLIIPFTALGLFYIGLGIAFGKVLKKLKEIDRKGVKVPILTYPECDLCSCNPDEGTTGGEDVDPTITTPGNKVKPCNSIVSNTDITSITLSPGILPLFNGGSFNLPVVGPDNPLGFKSADSLIYSTEFTGLLYDSQYASANIGAPVLILNADETQKKWWNFTTSLPLADRINLFNVKAKYFDNSTVNPGGGVNRISVNFQPTQTQNKHYDNTIVILCDKSTIQSLSPGQLLSFQNPTMSKDVNLTGGIINVYGNHAITGVTSTGQTNISVTYANVSGNGSTTVPYSVNITADTTNNLHKFPTDIEYFQVITGMTYSEFSGQCSTQINYNSLNNRYLNNTSLVARDYIINFRFPNFTSPARDYYVEDNIELRPMDYVLDHEQVCVLILNRGVDPYTPKVPISYGLGRLFGDSAESYKTVTGLYHMNIPIQGSYKNIKHLSSFLNNSNVNSDSYSGQKLYFNSFSYKPQIQTIIDPNLTGYTLGVKYIYSGVTNSGYSGFSSNLISYYSSVDNDSIGYGASCGGSGVSNIKLMDTNVANANTSYGLKISSNNRFSQYIYLKRPFLSSSIYKNYYMNYLDVQHPYSSTTVNNKGYFPGEIVEGGPLMYSNLDLNGSGATAPSIVYNVSDSAVSYGITSNYYTPIYNTSGNTLNFSSGSNGNQIVMRGDRLPTSTNVEEYCCNGMVLQKNTNFQIYLIPEDGVLNVSSSQGSTGSAGSGDFNSVVDDLAQSSGITKVFESFNCADSVNLDCYDCQSTNGPNGGPNSTIVVNYDGCREFNNRIIFQYGCYKFITTIWKSLFKDWELMFEWVARNMVLLGACRNVFSHRFVNNWINGVLYAFPFKNEIKGYTAPTFVPPNQPIMSYCTDSIRYHYQTKNFYYRATIYDTVKNEFRTNSDGNIGFPTTIIDLGPRSDYMQELVMSDEYDGYVANKLDSSSYGVVDDILNLFIVSRFINKTFLKTLLGAFNILAYFKNERGSVGNGGTKYMIDADYSQLISINSELGVAPFAPANYPDNPDQTKQNPIFFNCNNVLGIFFTADTQVRDYITPKRTIINPSGTTTSNCTFNNFPVYSQRVPLSQWSIQPNKDNKNRSYIFGVEKNNWDFSVSGGGGSNQTIFSHKYQSLDRLNSSSRYFRTTGSTQTQYQKGFIYGVTTFIDPITNVSSVDLSADVNTWDRNSPDQQLVTVGAPFHFYFGLRRGASSYDRFRTKWINTSNIVN